WASMRRGNGPRRDSRATGRRLLRWTPIRSSASTRCGPGLSLVRSRERSDSRKISRGNHTTEPGREGQTFHGRGRLLHHVNLARLPHTVFALPFALVGVVLASYVVTITVRAALWVIVAFTTAQIAAMSVT